MAKSIVKYFVAYKQEDMEKASLTAAGQKSYGLIGEHYAASDPASEA